MSTEQLAQRSFALLREGLAGDRAAMNDFVDAFREDSELWLPVTPSTKSPYLGREAIRALLVDFVVPLYRNGLHLTLHQTLIGSNRAVFQFEDRGIRAKDGSEYANSPCIALAFDGERIAGFWEYWGGPGFFRDSPGGRGAHGDVEDQAHQIALAALRELQAGLAGDDDALDAFLARLAEDARLWFPPTPNTRSPCVGRAAAVNLFKDLLKPMYPDGLYMRVFHISAAGTCTAFELQSYGVRADGSEYVNSPCLCFDVRCGRIQTMWEHWGGPGFFSSEIRFRSANAG